MFAGSPIEPPVMLAVSAVASRRTSTLRLVYEVIDVSVAAPSLYERFTSPSVKPSVYGSANCVNCSRFSSRCGPGSATPIWPASVINRC